METHIALNKIYRAVHDGVCPNCGAGMRFAGMSFDNVSVHTCQSCTFNVSDAEMMQMRPAVEAWGQEAVKEFQRWRSR